MNAEGIPAAGAEPDLPGDLPSGVEPRPANEASTVAITTQALASVDSTELDACWSRIGVWGDRSCSELKTHIHCRNCPAYSQASLRLLDRPLPNAYRLEWTEHYAREKKRVAPVRLSVLAFRLQNEWLALPAQVFQEVAEYRQIHSLPHRRRGLILGLANIRGELLICVSLHRLLGLEPRHPRPNARDGCHRLLVTAWEGNRFVLPADEVHGLQRFQPQELKEAPATLLKSQSSFTRGILHWRERTLGLLDPNPLFAALNRSLV